MLIAFDYDGVLVDSMEEIIKFANRARHLVGFNRQVTKEDLQNFENLTFESVGRFLGISEDNILRFSKQIMGLLQANLAKSKVFIGMPEVIRSLSNEHTIVLITSNLKDNVKKVLMEHDLDSSVKNIFDGSDPSSKSEKIIRAGSQYNFPTNQIIMIGDSKSDIHQGKVAGAKTIAVTWGYQPLDVLLTASPDYIAKSPSDIIEICEQAAAL